MMNKKRSGMLARAGILSFLFSCLLTIAGAQQQNPPRASREDQAAAELSACLRAHQAGQLEQAITRLKRAHTLTPDSPQVRLYLGLFLYEQNKDSLEAQRYMESIEDKFPDHGDLQLRLLDSYLRARNEAKSEALVGQLQARMAADSRFAFNVIYTLIRHGRIVSARREIDKVSNNLQGVSNNLQGEVLFIGGLIEFGSGQKSRALDLLEKASGHGFPPRESRQMLTLADSLFQLRAFPQAAKAYEAFFANHPDSNPAQRFWLGMIYYGYGHYERALEQMQRARKEAPTIPEIDFYLGIILIELKRPEEARPYLLAELKRDPSSYKAMTKLADLEYLAGQDDLCRQWLEKSMALNGQWFESYMVYGMLYNRLGEYEQAVKSLEACIRVEPEYPKAYFQLSNAWRRLGDEEKARQFLDRFNQLQEAAISRVRKVPGMGEKPPER
jgi:tetratricopeptide (TPR) repeat protein